MATLAKLLVLLGLDSAEYSKGLSDAERQADAKAKNIGESFNKVGQGMTNLGKTMSLGVTAPVVGGFALAINAASDMEETVSKSNVVFGDMAGEVQGFADTAATSLGISSKQALEAAGTYGNLFVSMGMGQNTAADMSTGLVQLASDLGSFNNMDPTQVLEKLRAGLTGETEPLKSLGVNLNAAAVAAKAADMGLATFTVDSTEVADKTLKMNDALEKYNKAVAKYGVDSGEAEEASVGLAKAQEALATAQQGSLDELSASAKAQATYALILEQTTTAQGDFARTSDGLANSTRTVKAQIADAAVKMGQMLLPFALKLAQAVSKLVTWFTNLNPATMKTIVIVLAIAAAIGPLLLIVGQLVSAIGAIIPVVGAVAGILSGPVLLVIGAVVGAIALLYLAWTNNWGGIRDTLTNIWNNILMPAFQAVRDWLQVNIPLAIQTLSNFWNNTLLPALNAVWTFIQTYILPIFQDAISIMEKITTIVGTAFAGFWDKVLKPALETAWKYFNENILPILQKVMEFIRDELGPKVQWLADNVFTPLANTLSGAVASALNWLHDKLTKIKGFLDKFKLPDWLTPGSPTPFELGIRGISDALSELNRIALPQFNANISGLGSLSPAYGNSTTMNTTSIGTVNLPGVNNPRQFLNEVSNLARNSRKSGSAYIVR
jgi:hypothetical protein